jgi:hypothetical protein
MKRLIAIALAFGLVGVVGCEQKTGTSPGTDPNKPKKLTLRVVENHTITQDKTDELTVTVTRSEHKDPVTIEVRKLPKGITLETKDLTIPGDKNTLTLTFKAAPDAPTGEFAYEIVAKSTDITSDPANVKLTVKAKS